MLLHLICIKGYYDYVLNKIDFCYSNTPCILYDHFWFNVKLSIVSIDHTCIKFV